jgi:ribosome-associated protein
MRDNRGKDAIIAVQLFDSSDVQDQERPSKTQRKREMHELQSLGERLVELNPEQLAAIALPEDLRDAIDAARRITRREARRRQLQYIGRLMRTVDPEPIREKLKVWHGLSAEHTAHMHRVERWRGRLMEEELAMREFAQAYVGADTQRLRALVRKAREERDAGRPPHGYRELFRALRDIMSETNTDQDDGRE